MAYFKNVNVDPESWDPAFLFTTPPEEKEEEEEIDEGNVQVGPTALAPGTVTPTETCSTHLIYVGFKDQR